MMTLITTFAHAQSVVRDTSSATIGFAITNYTNVGVNGLDVDGNPGFVAMYGVATGTGVGNAVRPQYYLWINDAGKLCLASYMTLIKWASFPNGNWGDNQMNGACTVVGGQS